MINIFLAVFNLIPIPPLDGFNILSNLIPVRSYKAVRVLETLEQYGMYILIALLLSGATKFIIGAPSNAIYNLIIDLI